MAHLRVAALELDQLELDGGDALLDLRDETLRGEHRPIALDL